MKWFSFPIAVFVLSSLMASTAVTASAADVAGTWKASIETPNGNFDSVFVFKVDAGKITGTVNSGPMGESAITEGKIDGDDISFVVAASFNGNDFKISYKGKVSGDEMKLSIQVPNMDQAFEIIAKRQAT